MHGCLLCAPAGDLARMCPARNRTGELYTQPVLLSTAPPPTRPMRRWGARRRALTPHREAGLHPAPEPKPGGLATARPQTLRCEAGGAAAPPPHGPAAGETPVPVLLHPAHLSPTSSPAGRAAAAPEPPACTAEPQCTARAARLAGHGTHSRALSHGHPGCCQQSGGYELACRPLSNPRPAVLSGEPP